MNQPSQSRSEDCSPADQFLNGAKSGVNRWWVWVLGILMILVIWQVIGSIPTLAACGFLKFAQLGDFTCDGAMIEGASSLPNFVLGISAFVIAMVGIWAVVRVLNKKPFAKVLTARPSFDLNRVLFAMLVGIS